LAADAYIRILIPIVDTWFGISVHPVVVAKTNRTLLAEQTYGRELNAKRCPYGPGSRQYDAINNLNYDANTTWIPCNLIFGDQFQSGLVDESAASETFAGLSLTQKVQNFTSAAETFYLLQDAKADQRLDYQAVSLAVTTQCTPMTTKCYHPNGTTENGTTFLDFQCTPGFKGNFNQMLVWTDRDGSITGDANVGIGFSPDAQFSTMLGQGTINDFYAEFIPQTNPFHFAVWGLDYPFLDGKTAQPIANDPELSKPTEFGDTAWILNCSSTVYDVEYTWINGSVTSHNLTKTTNAMGGMVAGPFAQGVNAPWTALTESVEEASFADSMDELADTFAKGFSRGAVAMTVGVMAPLRNKIEQTRDNAVSVTRVPIIPLYLLISFKAIYVVAVLILALGAYCFAHPAEMGIVKNQLSVKGLVAAHFEHATHLQEAVVQGVQSHVESSAGKAGDASSGRGLNDAAAKEPSQQQQQQEQPKVGIMPTADGTWKYMALIDGVWKSVAPLVTAVVLPEARAGKLGDVGDAYAAWKK
jgi:hypothetical protein